jgi:hypothetical protein
MELIKQAILSNEPLGAIYEEIYSRITAFLPKNEQPPLYPSTLEVLGYIGDQEVRTGFSLEPKSVNGSLLVYISMPQEGVMFSFLIDSDGRLVESTEELNDEDLGALYGLWEERLRMIEDPISVHFETLDVTDEIKIA